VAAALIDGRVTEKTFSSARLRDPRIAALIERMTITENPDFNRNYPAEWPCRIELTLRGGARKARELRYFKGHARNPLTDAEIEGKFRSLAHGRMPAAGIDRFLATAWRLEKLKDVGELLGLLKWKQ